MERMERVERRDMGTVCDARNVVVLQCARSVRQQPLVSLQHIICQHVNMSILIRCFSGLSKLKLLWYE